MLLFDSRVAKLKMAASTYGTHNFAHGFAHGEDFAAAGLLNVF